MDYKEKYEQALERARQFSENPYLEDSSGIVEYIFPELAEREDEKIKKEITELVMQPTWKTEKEFYRRKELCDWLEKQGEQNPTWSEEDENKLSDAVFFVREYQIPTRDKRLLNAAKEAEEWLKSLRPQKKEALPQWRRLPLNGVSYAPDYWCVMDVITSTVGANSASVSALVKGDYYVPLFELEKFIRNT